MHLGECSGGPEVYVEIQSRSSLSVLAPVARIFRNRDSTALETDFTGVRP
jgi:hypothetical protein